MSPCSTDGGSHSSNDSRHEASAGANAAYCAHDIERASASTLEKERLAVNRMTPTTKVELLAQPSVPVPKRHQDRLLSHAGLSARVAWPLL
ncbi:hypothetical protein ERJ75_000595700 [Trypanosoma vivax]|nr:hypothetical protein ERJ75_000595700 [Trypanosoma vivax]